ncbi:MAG: hypothetical protein HRF45_12600 [Fimbriimonadia bacterium]
MIVVALLIAPLLLAAGPSDYLPLKVGNRWTYRQTAGDGKETVVNRVTKVRKKGDQQAFVLEVRGEKGDKTTSVLYWTADGLVQEDSTAAKFSPPMVELKLPAKPGTVWEWSGTVTIGGGTYKASAKCQHTAIGKLTVPAGTFDVLVVSKTVTVEAGSSPIRITTTDSYALGVGWVKGVLDANGKRTVTELVSYELAK